jgi:hypothetical protein
LEVVPVSNNKYPFQSKSSIRARIETDDDFVLMGLQILLSRQTETEQETRTTREKNARGFMSSHAVRGTLLATRARGDGLSAEEMATARMMVSHYSRQLADHFKQEAIANDPALQEVARVFSGK